MFLREDKEIENSLEEEKDTKPLSNDNINVEYPMEGEILIIRRGLSLQIKEDEE